jgi:hypothetical protein
MRSTSLAILTLTCLFVVTGCRRSLTTQMDYNPAPDKPASADLPAARSIFVEFFSKDSTPVSAYLVRREDATAALSQVNSGTSPQEVVKQLKYITVVEGASGAITPPKSEDKIAWSILFVTKKPTTVTVTTRAGQ